LVAFAECIVLGLDSRESDPLSQLRSPGNNVTRTFPELHHVQVRRSAGPLISFLVRIGVDANLQGLMLLHINVKIVVILLGIYFNTTPPEL
jgi:hypothetical protein